MIKTHNINCSYEVETSLKNHKIWLIRIKILSQLLQEGYDVILSDSDAVWLKNPFIEIQFFAAFDIISSRAVYPVEITKRLGASLCMVILFNL